MNYCYIIYSEKLDKYYIGSTKAVQGRLERHNTSNKGFTSTGKPWELKYFEEYTEKKMDHFNFLWSLIYQKYISSLKIDISLPGDFIPMLQSGRSRKVKAAFTLRTYSSQNLSSSG